MVLIVGRLIWIIWIIHAFNTIPSHHQIPTPNGTRYVPIVRCPRCGWADTGRARRSFRTRTAISTERKRGRRSQIHLLILVRDGVFSSWALRSQCVRGERQVTARGTNGAVCRCCFLAPASTASSVSASCQRSGPRTYTWHNS